MGNVEYDAFRTGKPALASVIDALLQSVSETAQFLRQEDSSGQVGSSNTFGDKQLKIDVKADDVIFHNLRACGAVATASSEERAEEHDLGGQGYSVAFDPLDGSSIVDANFAVGAIFGIWEGPGLLGRTGAEQVAAAYAVYGPRTSIILAHPGTKGELTVEELTLQNGKWSVSRSGIRIGEKKVFAPANLRAAADNKAYADLISAYIGGKYTLRYTGGFVPDVNHIMTKGGGLFVNPQSSSARAKLRLLYECAPLAFIVEAAGGASSNGQDSILKLKIDSLDRRTVITLGSKGEVARQDDMHHIDIRILSSHLRQRRVAVWDNLDVCPRTCPTEDSCLCTYKNLSKLLTPAGRHARSLLDLSLPRRCMQRILRFRMGCHKDDIISVARYIDACSERVYTSAGHPLGDQASD